MLGDRVSQLTLWPSVFASLGTEASPAGEGRGATKSTLLLLWSGDSLVGAVVGGAVSGDSLVGGGERGRRTRKPAP